MAIRNQIKATINFMLWARSEIYSLGCVVPRSRGNGDKHANYMHQLAATF
jgi:hypothetical protein